MTEHRESPIKRTNPSGAERWVARYTAADGKRYSAGTFKLKRDAQAAIDAAYKKQSSATETVGSYYDRWLALHPRTPRTEACYTGRVKQVLDVPIGKRKLRDWPLGDFRRRQARDLLDVLLREQKRSASGAKGILLVMSAMWADAMDDEQVDSNPFMGLRVRASDPRVTKPPRELRVWSWEDMHRFAAACGPFEPAVRVLSDCGLRIGEMFPLVHADRHDGVLEVRRTAWNGTVTDGTKTDHGEAHAGRTVPLPPDLDAMLAAMPRRIDTPLLFPKKLGHMFHGRDWYRDVWGPAKKATGIDPRPHEFRHSWVSHLRAAGVDIATLAAAAGHTVETATAYYTHPTGQAELFDAMRKAVGS